MGQARPRPREIFRDHSRPPFRRERAERRRRGGMIRSSRLGFPHGEASHPRKYVGAQLSGMNDRELRIMRDNLADSSTSPHPGLNRSRSTTVAKCLVSQCARERAASGCRGVMARMRSATEDRRGSRGSRRAHRWRVGQPASMRRQFVEGPWGRRVEHLVGDERRQFVPTTVARHACSRTPSSAPEARACT